MTSKKHKQSKPFGKRYKSGSRHQFANLLCSFSFSMIPRAVFHRRMEEEVPIIVGNDPGSRLRPRRSTHPGGACGNPRQVRSLAAYARCHKYSGIHFNAARIDIEALGDGELAGEIGRARRELRIDLVARGEWGGKKRLNGHGRESWEKRKPRSLQSLLNNAYSRRTFRKAKEPRRRYRSRRSNRPRPARSRTVSGNLSCIPHNRRVRIGSPSRLLPSVCR